jgi:hypothetical protein
VNGWRDFHYVISSAPGECPYDLKTVPSARIEMVPRGEWIIMADADACFVALAGAQGMIATAQANCFAFTGNRPVFDDWMTMHHPQVTYCWRDDFVLGFADDRTRRAFNTELGGRVVLYTYLQTV